MQQGPERNATGIFPDSQNRSWRKTTPAISSPNSTRQLHMLSSRKCTRWAISSSNNMECELFTYDDIQRAIKKVKSGSAPSHFDCIGYHIFKRCPALMPALLDLFNLCWTQCAIPQQWKWAMFKLLAKGSAASDATNPCSFCPIALQTFHNLSLKTLAKVHDNQ